MGGNYQTLIIISKMIGILAKIRYNILEIVQTQEKQLNRH